MNKSVFILCNKNVFRNALKSKFAYKQLCCISSNLNDKYLSHLLSINREYHVSQKGVEFSMKNKNKSEKLVWKSTSSHVYISDNRLMNNRKQLWIKQRIGEMKLLMLFFLKVIQVQ